MAVPWEKTHVVDSETTTLVRTIDRLYIITYFLLEKWSLFELIMQRIFISYQPCTTSYSHSYTTTLM